MRIHISVSKMVVSLFISVGLLATSFALGLIFIGSDSFPPCGWAHIFRRRRAYSSCMSVSSVLLEIPPGQCSRGRGTTCSDLYRRVPATGWRLGMLLVTATLPDYLTVMKGSIPGPAALTVQPPPSVVSFISYPLLYYVSLSTKILFV
jgi:hypothetical protein